MNENRKPSELPYEPIPPCFAECEDIAFSLMSAAKDRQQKRLFEKLYESIKFSDKISADGPMEMKILSSITSFSRALREGQYDQHSYEALERNINRLISDIEIRNKKLLESKRGGY